MTAATLQKIKTIGPIAREKNAPIHQIRYIIESRGIRAVGRIGHSNVYDEEAVEQISEALKEIRGA